MLSAVVVVVVVLTLTLLLYCRVCCVGFFEKYFAAKKK